MKRSYQDFFLSYNPNLIGRLFCNKLSGDNEHRIVVYKMDKWNTHHSIDLSEAFLKAVKKLSKGKMGERTSIPVKSLTIVRGESGRMFVTRGETISICLVDYVSDELVVDNEKRLKESYDFLIKVITLILKWGKESKPGSKPKLKFPTLPNHDDVNTNCDFIDYPNSETPSVFSNYTLPNAGGFNINIEGSQYSEFITNKNGELQGHLPELIEGLELIQKNSQVYQMVKLSKTNPSHYVTSSPGEHKDKDGKRIPIVVINFDNTKSLNKVLFAGYPETLKDLISKLKETSELLINHFNKEIVD